MPYEEAILCYLFLSFCCKISFSGNLQQMLSHFNGNNITNGLKNYIIFLLFIWINCFLELIASDFE